MKLEHDRFEVDVKGDTAYVKDKKNGITLGVPFWLSKFIVEMIVENQGPNDRGA